MTSISEFMSIVLELLVRAQGPTTIAHVIGVKCWIDHLFQKMIDRLVPSVAISRIRVIAC